MVGGHIQTPRDPGQRNRDTRGQGETQKLPSDTQAGHRTWPKDMEGGRDRRRTRTPRD